MLVYNGDNVMANQRLCAVKSQQCALPILPAVLSYLINRLAVSTPQLIINQYEWVSILIEYAMVPVYYVRPGLMDGT